MKYNLLIVDDEKFNLEALERVFRKQFQVFLAPSGKEALELMKQNTISVIISDHRMPEMTGVEFLKRSIELQPNATRILLTGYTDIESVIGAINSGQIYRYITKPWDTHDLNTAVQQAVERYEFITQLQEKNRRLEQMVKELQALDQAKDQFMMLINHELKTPLTVISSYTQLMNETNLNEDQKTYFEKINQSVERLQRLIYDSLDLMRAELGKLEINLENNQLDLIAKKSLDSIQKKSDQKLIRVITSGLNQAVKADAKHLERCLTHLLDNAIKFGKEGSLVHLDAKEISNGIEISVTNVGKTISPDMMQKILKPFTLDENVMNHSQGLGMGLSLTSALLKLHHSQLNIKSDDEKTTVSFILPKS